MKILTPAATPTINLSLDFPSTGEQPYGPTVEAGFQKLLDSTAALQNLNAARVADLANLDGAHGLRLTNLEAASAIEVPQWVGIDVPIFNGSEYPPAGARSYGSLHFYKHAGRVYLQGYVNALGTPGSASLLFVLPVGYRPGAQVGFALGTSAYPLGVTLYENGDVTQNPTAGVSTYNIALSFRLP